MLISHFFVPMALQYTSITNIWISKDKVCNILKGNNIWNIKSLSISLSYIGIKVSYLYSLE